MLCQWTLTVAGKMKTVSGASRIANVLVTFEPSIRLHDTKITKRFLKTTCLNKGTKLYIWRCFSCAFGHCKRAVWVSYCFESFVWCPFDRHAWRVSCGLISDFCSCSFCVSLCTRGLLLSQEEDVWDLMHLVWGTGEQVTTEKMNMLLLTLILHKK